MQLLPHGHLCPENVSMVLDDHGLLLNVSSGKEPKALQIQAELET